MNKYIKLLKEINDTPQHEEESILLIDGLNTFLRNFSVINHLNKAGEPVGGLIGTLKSIGYASKLISPSKIILIFDGVGGSVSKKNLYPEYKANRLQNRITNYSLFSSKEEENESINNQVSRLMQYLQCLPVHIICIDAVEADDIIGYLVSHYEKNSNTKTITIMSSDKDFLQLLSEKTFVFSPSKKKIYKKEDIIEEYNVLYHNFIWYKILMGDKSDNLPGIPGLGPKKLEKLFPELKEKEINSLEEILSISQNKINENKLYSSVIERKKQLEINERLMDLKNVTLSDENLYSINNNLSLKYNLERHLFLQMYFSDKLDNEIINLSGWLTQCFGFIK